MLKPWMVIGGVTIAIALLSNIIRPKDVKWFRRLKRPDWLTFEKLIPVIWTTVFICGAWSAYIIWSQTQSWGWMMAYAALELITVAFTPVLFWSHSLLAASFIGAAGFVLGLLLALAVLSLSGWASLLLVPYLLWSPIGTFTTWQMHQLNPSQNSSQ